MAKTDAVVHISEEDAGKWVLFQQYFDPFDIMVNAGVFKVRNGGVTLNFDKDGVLKTITRADILYREGYGDIRPSIVKG